MMAGLLRGLLSGLLRGPLRGLLSGLLRVMAPAPTAALAGVRKQGPPSTEPNSTQLTRPYQGVIDSAPPPTASAPPAHAASLLGSSSSQPLPAPGLGEPSQPSVWGEPLYQDPRLPQGWSRQVQSRGGSYDLAIREPGGWLFRGGPWGCQLAGQLPATSGQYCSEGDNGQDGLLNIWKKINVCTDSTFCYAICPDINV